MGDWVNSNQTQRIKLYYVHDSQYDNYKQWNEKGNKLNQERRVKFVYNNRFIMIVAESNYGDIMNIKESGLNIDHCSL